MKKSYLKCPYGECGELTISGMKMHVRKTHPDKYDEFVKNYDELKTKAVVRESSTKQPATAVDPPKVIDPTPTPLETKPPKEPAEEGTGKGDKKPPQAKSFLDEFGEWLDSPEF